MNQDTQVLIFGVFDTLHDGHRFFIEQAQTYGNKLIISVAQDSSVLHYKKRAPVQTQDERMRALREAYPEALVVPGDNEQNTWSAIHMYHPQIIALGYDQHALRERLLEIKDSFEYPYTVVTVDDHRGHELHSSLLRDQG